MGLSNDVIPQLGSLGGSAVHAGVLDSAAPTERLCNLLDLLGQLPKLITIQPTERRRTIPKASVPKAQGKTHFNR